MNHFLAIDLGAESGRGILGSLSGDQLTLEEIHRFLNEPVHLPTGLYWDSFRLFHDIQHSLRIAGRERKLKVDGIGVDTWGVDFGILGSDGALIDNPRCYRDPRTERMFERLFAVVPRERVFEETGLQFMELNSLYQLYAMKLACSPGLQSAAKLLFMPDLLAYWLTGVQKNELTITSTSQFYNPSKKRWATELFDDLGLPKHILGDIVAPGTLLGPLLPHLGESTALGDTPVYASAAHDTAAAVAAVPASGRDWCYISSGTWSLMGVELDEPIINEACLAANFTNEIGVDGKVRFLKNIAGLWLLQECRRAWALEGTEYSYAELAAMADSATPFSAVVPPDRFLQPGKMPQRIADFCKGSGQRVPESAGDMARAILEGLALRYRQVLETLELLLGRKLTTIHIVGGGSRNQVLNQFVADATRRTVIAGPAEATAAGNILVQAIGSGRLRNLAEARAVIAASFPVETIQPQNSAPWDAAYEQFCKLC